MIQTITIDTNNAFVFTSSESIQEHLQWKLQNGARVLTVTRPLFSSRFVITIDAWESTTRDWIAQYVVEGLHELGFSNISVVSIEGGYTSSQGGGIGGAVTGIADYSKSIITPIAIIAGALLVGVIILQEKR